MSLRTEDLDQERIVPLVSAFMKSFNHERFIAEAIESVLTQDFEDLELIIVDDASTDASREIVERYAEQDPRIRVIFHERNLGISKVVNDGIDAARGKFVSQIDSDDVWVTDKLTKQLAVLEEDENVIVWSEGELIDENGRSLGKSFSEKDRSVSKKKSGDLFETLLSGNYIFGSTLMYKRTNLGDLRYDKRFLYNNDYKFLLQLAHNYKFCYVAEPLAKYRVHGKNTLVGSGRQAQERRRAAYREEISIRQEALLQNETELSGTTKAYVYARNGFCYSKLGQDKRALQAFLYAIRSNPHGRLNPVYSAIIFTLGIQAMLGAWNSKEVK